MPQTLNAKDLLVTEGILTCEPSCTLAQALAKLNSSHDAVFVVDNKNKVLGVISPYYVIFQSNFPAATKVANCLFSPPKLKLTTPIWEIARHMVQSKVYFLPVFSQKGQWEGIVSVRRIMQEVMENPEIANRISLDRRTKRIITIGENATLNEARALLRNGGVSRLPVVDSMGKLIGILTRYDLREAFVSPKTSQRFLSREGQKRKYLNRSIRAFYKKAVITVNHPSPIEKMIATMLERRIGSIIVVNAKWLPVKIISYHDLLEAVSRLEYTQESNIRITFPQAFEYEPEMEGIVYRLFKKLRKQNKLVSLDVKVSETRNQAQKSKMFNVTLTTFHPKAGSFIGKGSDYRWRTALRQAVEKVDKQTRRK